MISIVQPLLRRRRGDLRFWPVFACLLFSPAPLWAQCSPDVPDNSLTPEDESLPLSGDLVVCTGVDDNGFVRVDDPVRPFLNRDNLTVTVLGIVRRNAGDVIHLQGDSHAIILNGGAVEGIARIEGILPGFTVLGDGTAEFLIAQGDGAFLNVSGLADVGAITLEGADANATISGSLIGNVLINGNNPTLNMDGGFITQNLQVIGDNGTSNFTSGVNTRVEIIGTDTTVTVDGGGYNDTFRVQGDGATATLNAGMFNADVEIAGVNAVLTNHAVISGGVDNNGDALVDNFGSILGAGVFMTQAGGRLLNRGDVTTTDDDANALFSTALNTDVDNRGTMVTGGDTADALVFEGNKATLTNRDGAVISTTGAESTAVFSEGDETTVDNLSGAMIVTIGDGSSGVFLDGDGSTINNAGGVTTAGALAPALSVFGLNGVLDNDADVTTTGQTSFGLLLASRRDDAGPNPRMPTLTNSAKVETSSAFSSALVGLGAELEIINEATGEIVTGGTASNGHGIAIGFQDPPPLPVGVAIPLGVFDPAQGAVINEGTIHTSGFLSAGIHAFANDSRIENRNSIVTTGAFANGIDAEGNNLTIINDGTVGIENDQATGIRVVGNDATIEIRAMVQGGPAKNVTVLGDFVDGVNAMGDRLKLMVDGLIVAGADSSEAAVAVRFDGADAEIKIEGMLDSNGLQPIGISGTNANGAEIINNGKVDVAGPDAIGIDVTGDNVRVNNVGFDPANAARVDAQIIVDGDNAMGIRTSGAGAFVSNRKAELADATEIIGLDVSGEFARGIDVIATGNGGYLVENAGQMRISGSTPPGMQINEIVGMALRNPTNSVFAFGQSNFQSSCLGSGMGAGLLNCGRLEVNGTSAVGMLATGLNGSIVENAGDIVSASDGMTGISVRTGFGTVRSTNNIVLSLEDIQLVGDNTTGISVVGDDNILMHGQDVVVLDVDTGAVDIPTIQVISVQVDRMSSIPGANSMPLADLFVSGNDAVGISIDGQDNVVAVSLVTQFIPLPGGGQSAIDVPATVVAQGAGSVGVRFAGTGNRLLNMGRILGEGLAIEGGDGDDHVVSFGSVDGRTELFGGNDSFQFAPLDAFVADNAPDRRAIRGDVDGGDGNDLLQVDTGDPFPNQTFFEIGTMDGDQFTNFERFDKLGDLPVVLDNSLELVTPTGGNSKATIVDGGLVLSAGSLLSAQEIEVQAGAEILGFGTLGVDPSGPGFVDRSTIRILDGGLISGGNSPGTLTIFGNLELDGTLLTEIDGLLTGQFDQLNVLGDVILGSSAVFDMVFGNGFAPQEGDMVEFIMAESVLGSLGLLEVNIFGLQDGFEFDLALGANGIVLTALNDGVSQIPLPPSLLMLISGLLSFLGFARRR